MSESANLPQGAYDLYDQYCHGRISRRQFLDTLPKHAVGGVTLSMLLAGLTPNYALAREVDPDDPRIVTERFKYQSPKGAGDMEGLLARPVGEGPWPGVLVVHENRGLNPYIEDVARRLAVEGYVALAPDALYPLGGYPGNDDDGRELQRQRDGDKMLEDFIAGAETLRDLDMTTDSIGTVGFCFGGRVTNMLAVRLPWLKAVVPYYGGWPTAEEAAQVEAPLLLQMAENDGWVNEGWPTYEAALTAEGKEYTAYIYPGTQHGFHNDTTSRYNEEAAKLSWKRTLAFFDKHLK